MQTHSYDKYQIWDTGYLWINTKFEIVVIPLFEIVVTKGALIVYELCWYVLVFF